jgi:hypothetical protein
MIKSDGVSKEEVTSQQARRSCGMKERSSLRNLANVNPSRCQNALQGSQGDGKRHDQSQTWSPRLVEDKVKNKVD